MLLADAVKYDRSASVLACKQGLLMIHSHGREQALLKWGRKSRARVARKGVARGRSGKSPGWPEARWPESFVLRVHIVGCMEVKKLHID